MKFYIIILLLSLGLVSLSSYTTSHSYNIQQDDFVYDFVEQMPEFPGGKIALKKYIKDHTIYPERVKKAGIKGNVYAECIIEKDGVISNVKVFTGISHKLEKETLKLVQGMPNWIPGKQKNKIVRVKMIIKVAYN